MTHSYDFLYMHLCFFLLAMYMQNNKAHAKMNLEVYLKKFGHQIRKSR
uniref:Uncharacterized protein n=1 Tax=Setaria italica TaxID=4555 RepID=K3ZFL5_SETIT